jgi:hypothetical protein
LKIKYISVIAAIAATTSIATVATAYEYDRYSGFECYGYNWAPGTDAEAFNCPIVNRSPNGLADVARVDILFTVPHSTDDFMCYREWDDTTYDLRPRAKACSIYAAHGTYGAYGSNCGNDRVIENSTSGGTISIDLDGTKAII